MSFEAGIHLSLSGLYSREPLLSQTVPYWLPVRPVWFFAGFFGPFLLWWGAFCFRLGELMKKFWREGVERGERWSVGRTRLWVELLGLFMLACLLGRLGWSLGESYWGGLLGQNFFNVPLHYSFFS